MPLLCWPPCPMERSDNMSEPEKMLCSACGQMVDPEGHRWECHPVEPTPPNRAAPLSENEFLAARDVAEAEFEKYRAAGVSVGGSITAAVRAAFHVFELRATPPASGPAESVGHVDDPAWQRGEIRPVEPGELYIEMACCGLRYSADHKDVTGGYSCPLCAPRDAVASSPAAPKPPSELVDIVDQLRRAGKPSLAARLEAWWESYGVASSGPATPSAAAIDAAEQAARAWLADPDTTGLDREVIASWLRAAYAVDRRPAGLTVERLAEWIDEIDAGQELSALELAQRLLPRLTGAR